MTDKLVEEIKKEFEEGTSVTQVEPHEYRPLPVKFKDPAEEELIEAAMRDRESVVLVNGHPEGGTLEEQPTVVDPLQMLDDFINGR